MIKVIDFSEYTTYFSKKLIMVTEAILLRTLTPKSILWFGKHEGKSVRQIIDLRDSQYIRWIYYNVAGVSFTDEVLDMIKLPQEYEINKPGIDVDLGEKVMALAREHVDPKKRNGIAVSTKKRLKAKYTAKRKYRQKYNTKKYMQLKNQGH